MLKSNRYNYVCGEESKKIPFCCISTAKGGMCKKTEEKQVVIEIFR